jgi:hypothetical protein
VTAPRREFSPKVREEIITRATNKAGFPVCEKCGGVLKRGAFEIDHVLAEGLVVDKSAKLTAKDGQLLGACCHRGEDGKTNRDVKAIAKAKRRRRKHNGDRRKTRQLIAGSRGTPWKRKMNGTTERRY